MKVRLNDRKALAAGIIALTLIGAYFRLVRLGDASLRGDSLEFWRICQQPTTAAGIFSNWMSLMGLSGQFPFSMAATKWFLDTFHLSVTLFNLRLPSAIWGIVTIPVAFGLGCRLWNVRCGFLLGLLFALNPFHIQMSREAYYYPPLVLGACMALWGSIWSVQYWKHREHRAKGIPFSFYVLNLAGFFLLTYSQPTGWMIGLLCGATSLAALVLASPSIKKWSGSVWLLLAGYFVVGLPLLSAAWALPQLRQISQGEVREASMKAFAVSTETFGGMMFKAATSFAWGGTAPRALLTVVALGFGVAFLAAHWKKWNHLALIPLLMVGGITAFAITREKAGALFEARYVIGLLPAYLGLLALGLIHATSLLAGAASWAKNRPQLLDYGVPAVAMAMFLYPADLCTRLTGQPTPYKDVVAWADANFPKGTPVLVDRWFEPWNELRAYPASNVVFAFTIPNEPVEVFLQHHWRDTVTNFFAKYPDAVYLEIAKTYWEVPGVGAWSWPRTYFNQHVGITNVAGLKLRELGLAGRGDYYTPTTNRLVVDVFYNTRNDNLARMHREGRLLNCLYGSGWGYEKSGPAGFLRIQTTDFHDWRVLESTATLELVNLNPAPVAAMVLVRGVAAGGSKQVQITADLSHTFGGSQLGDWQIGPMELQPGINVLKLSDPLWGLAKTPLLVDSVQIRAVAIPAAPAATNAPPPAG